jgi:hypothetical protein
MGEAMVCFSIIPEGQTWACTKIQMQSREPFAFKNWTIHFAHAILFVREPRNANEGTSECQW